MRNTTSAKARRILIPASAVIKPTATDIDDYGAPAYAASDHSDGGLTYAPINRDGVIDTLQRNAPSYSASTPSLTRVGVYLPSGDDFTLYDAVTGLIDYPATHEAFAPVSVPPVVDTDTDNSTVPNAEPIGVSAGTAIGAEPASLNDRALARAAAALAVAAFYSGSSMPFKAAADLKRKSPINFALNRSPSARSAALLAAILTYCDVQPGTLTFVRGSGAVPGRLLGLTGDDAARIFHAGPESGGLSNLIPDRISYVSGPLAGPGCENAVFRINRDAALSNLRAHNEKQTDGEHLFSAAIGLLDMLAQAPSEPASD